IRNFAELFLGGFGAVVVVVGLIGGNVHVTFLLPYGMVLAMVGLVFLGAFVGGRGGSDEVAYRAGLTIAAAGLLVVVIALGRSFIQAGWFQPSGFLLLVIGLVFGLVGVGLFSDWSVLVLTRRELGAFFYSPIAYIALIVSAVLAWLNYWFFLLAIHPDNPPLNEPIVRNYIFDLFPVITVTVVVPLLTMRLLSEEQRSGTFEVLLTAPVSEAAIVVSKF